MEKHTQVLLLVATGVFMSTLDSSMLNVALPSIMKNFSSSLALTEWVVLIYLLTITIMLLVWGNLTKKYGQEKIYTTGALIFSIGSFLCFLGSGIYLLIFFRFIQALGASMMMAVGPALIKSVFPQEKLGRGLGMIGIATSLGLMSGPALSGILIRWANWRLIFLVTVPIGLLVYFFGKQTCQPRNTTSPDAQIIKHPFDSLGALLWACAISMTLIMTTHATAICCSSKADSTLFIGGIGLTLVLWFVFALNELRQPYPLLPVKLFRRRFFFMAMLSGMLSFSVLFFVLLLTPFYLRAVKRLSADQTGYVMMALPLCVFFVSPIAGRLHDRIGAKIVATTGLGICLVGLLLLTSISAVTPPLQVAALLAVLGFGQAMFLSPNSAAALAGVNHQQAGVTSSLLATARNLGMLTGTALAGLLFTLTFSGLTGGLDMKDFQPEYTAQFIVSLHKSFQAAAVIAAVGVAASWWRGKTPA